MVWILGYFCTWRTVAWLSIIPPLLTLTSVIFFPETPYWLIENNELEKGKKSLQFFRGAGYDVQYEINEIQEKHLEKQANMEKNWDWTIRRLLSPAFLKPFSCIGVLWTLNTFSGFLVFSNYQYDIMEISGSTIDPGIAPLTIGIIRLLLIGIYSVVVYHFLVSILKS